MDHLTLKSFGPIADANIEFSDLTLLVGPQASGKSILLQLIKLIMDRHNIPAVLKQNNYEWGKKKENFLDLFFCFKGKKIRKRILAKRSEQRSRS